MLVVNMQIVLRTLKSDIRIPMFYTSETRLKMEDFVLLPQWRRKNFPQ